MDRLIDLISFSLKVYFTIGAILVAGKVVIPIIQKVWSPVGIGDLISLLFLLPVVVWLIGLLCALTIALIWSLGE